MKGLPILALLLFAVGCASGSGSIPRSASSGSRERVDVDGVGRTASVETDRRSTVNSVSLAMPRAQVWPLLAGVYSDLGLPVTTIDPGTFLLGVQNQRVREIGGKRVREFFDCGLGYVTSGRDVYVLVRTQLTPAASGGTTAETQVDAYGRSNESSGGARCSSTGALEMLIAERLRSATAAKQP